MSRRLDPFFQVETPVIFAHRGGAGEVPESTEEAFRHAALSVGVDVLELDIQVTADQEIVVWHGPGLKNVHNGRWFLRNWRIHEAHYHRELERRAWVVHPNHPQAMVKSSSRTLMTLEEFLSLVNGMEQDLVREGRPRTLHLNIELKPGNISPWNSGVQAWSGVWDRLFELLRREAESRRIILASARHRILEALRNEMGCGNHGSYVTNLSPSEQLSFRHFMSRSLSAQAFRLVGLFCLKPVRPPAAPYAMETYYQLSTPELVQRVRGEGGALYVFLTKFKPFPSVDDKREGRLAEVMKRFIDMGIDGFMTDYPEKVMKILHGMGLAERRTPQNL
ncbi:MAG: hypothetical protein GX422_05115 [Deltaproteobacteria bacterium]|nr:hypothetical protein [Deltaproteobacteria bacterium]